MALVHDEEVERKRLALQTLINGYQISQAIHVLVTLDIPDLLGAGVRSVEDLADLTGSKAETLYRLLRALAAAGLLIEGEGRRFSLSPLGDGLRRDAPHSRNAWAKFAARPPHWAAWGELLHSVRVGENAFRHVHGQDVWSYRMGHHDEAQLFDLAMREHSTRLAMDLAARYDFGQVRRLIDVGGGDGGLLAALLQECPLASGVLLDLPHVAANAKDVLEQVRVAERCSVVAGSFFEHIPPGGDCYLLKHILHDWDDAQALIILRNCRAAMEEGRLLIIERLIAPPNEGPEAKLADLNMLVNAGGRERRAEEFAALLAETGFVVAAILQLSGGQSLIEVRLRPA